MICCILWPDNNVLGADDVHVPMQTKMKIEVKPQHILLSQTLTLNLLTIVWWPVAFWSFPERAKDVHMHNDISSQLDNNSRWALKLIAHKYLEQSFAAMHKINGQYHTINFYSRNGLPMFLTGTFHTWTFAMKVSFSELALYHQTVVYTVRQLIWWKSMQPILK